MKYDKRTVVAFVCIFIFLRLLFTYDFLFGGDFEAVRGMIPVISGFVLITMFSIVSGIVLCDIFYHDGLLICVILITGSLLLDDFNKNNTILAGIFAILGLFFASRKYLSIVAPLFLIPATIAYVPSVFYSLPIMISAFIFAESVKKSDKKRICVIESVALTTVALFFGIRFRTVANGIMYIFGELAAIELPYSFSRRLISRHLVGVISPLILVALVFLYMIEYQSKHNERTLSSKSHTFRYSKKSKQRNSTAATGIAVVCVSALSALAGYIITGYTGSFAGVYLVIAIALKSTCAGNNAVQSRVQAADMFLSDHLILPVTVLFLIVTFAFSFAEHNSILSYITDFMVKA